MSGVTVYHGICQGGPRDGKTAAHTSLRLPGEQGFYAYMPAKGTTPSGWHWIEQKDAKQ